MRQVPQNAIDLIKHHEKCKLTAYLDPGGIPTIGWGHTGGVKLNTTISQIRADALLEADLADSASCIESSVRNPLSDNQFGALVSLVFNIGTENFKQSTLLKDLNAGQYDLAADQFSRWIYVKGQKSMELIKRRDEERTLFLTTESPNV